MTQYLFTIPIDDNVLQIYANYDNTISTVLNVNRIYYRNNNLIDANIMLAPNDQIVLSLDNNSIVLHYIYNPLMPRLQVNEDDIAIPNIEDHNWPEKSIERYRTKKTLT